MSVFRDRGVPKPTSKMSPRAPAQMGQREAEREGGRKVAGDGRERGGNPAAFVFVPRPGRVVLFACFMCYLWTDAAKDRDNYKQYYCLLYTSRCV